QKQLLSGLVLLVGLAGLLSRLKGGDLAHRNVPPRLRIGSADQWISLAVDHDAVIGSFGGFNRLRKLTGRCRLDHLDAKARSVGSKINWQLWGVLPAGFGAPPSVS